jgi:hypothetical protein
MPWAINKFADITLNQPLVLQKPSKWSPETPSYWQNYSRQSPTSGPSLSIPSPQEPEFSDTFDHPEADEPNDDALRSIPSRKKLSELMGIEHNDKGLKQKLRRCVEEFCVQRNVKFDKSWNLYSVEMLWPLVKACTLYMNRSILTGKKPWTRSTTLHVMHAICLDKVRNNNSRAQAARKRRAKKLRSEGAHIYDSKISGILGPREPAISERVVEGLEDSDDQRLSLGLHGAAPSFSSIENFPFPWSN